MTAGKYGYDLLQRHSNSVSLDARRAAKDEMAKVRSVFAALSKHFAYLLEQPRSHANNVKLALTTRFANHLYSAVMLIERGLLLDGAGCLRAATETTAFYWLVCKEPSSCVLYDGPVSPRPVEIRRRLEGLGVSVESLRLRYSIESEVTHVGNPSDNLQIEWEKSKSGALLYGGGFRPEIQKLMLQDIQIYLVNFLSGDPDYEVQTNTTDMS